MQDTLPPNHGLPAEVLANDSLLFREDGTPHLTDVQWVALRDGVARGASALILAPTSTGKTQIAAWALASWIARDRIRQRVVYLVTHRSLANQTFDEFRHLLLNTFFDGDGDAVVLATGDRQINAAGNTVLEPLRATLLIATYEKYLGLLCGSGIPSDLQDTCVIADEVQIIGDKTRGVAIEILLTLVKQAQPGQFVGLSAVLSEDDGYALADWLDVQLIRILEREKHLLYECRTPTRCFTFRTSEPAHGNRNESLTPGKAADIQALIRECMDADKGKPIIVFCMRKQDISNGCRAYLRARGVALTPAPLLEGLSSDTSEAEFL